MANTSISTRLTLTYASALFFSLVAFAVFMLMLVSYSDRTEYERELLRITRAVDGFSTWHDGAFHPGEVNQARIAEINGTTAETAIFRAGGGLVYASSPVVPAFVRNIGLTAPAHDYAQAMQTGNDRYIAAISPLVYDGIAHGLVVSWRNEGSWMRVERRVTLMLLFAAPLLAVVALLFGRFIARSGLRPLYAMASTVEEIEARHLSRRLELGGMPRELERLANAFNKMLDRLEAAFARERQFTADASHELRAPLTVIQAMTDYTLQADRDSTEYRRALQTIGLEAKDLENLIRDLLAAARNESALGAAPAVSDLSAVAFDVIQELYPVARARHITVTHDFPETLDVAIGAQSATRVLRILLDNALRHAESSISVRIEHDAREAVVTVTDDGAGFSDDALHHATERFWRDDPSHQRGEGSGLGLSIALNLTRAAGGTIALRNTAEHRAQVGLTLPLVL